VGARVTVEAGGLTLVQVVGATPSYLSQPDLTLHFGLAAAASVDRVEVRWPGGDVQELRDVPADQLLAVEQAR